MTNNGVTYLPRNWIQFLRGEPKNYRQATPEQAAEIKKKNGERPTTSEIKRKIHEKNNAAINFNTSAIQ